MKHSNKDTLDYDYLVQSREIYAVGEIDEEFYIKLMKNISVLESEKPGSKMTIYLCSPGGHIHLALGLYDRITHINSEVKIVVYGEASSAASIILQAADIREVSFHSTLLIHDLQHFEVGGNQKSLEDYMSIAKKYSEYMLDIYEEKTSMTRRQLYNKFKSGEWYITSEEAIELGFADEQI